MAEKSIILQLLEKLSEYYKPKDITPAQIDLYLDALEQYDFAFLWDAAQEHMRNSVFFPKISELVDLTERITERCSLNRLNTQYWQRRQHLVERMEANNRSTRQDPAEYLAIAEGFDSIFSFRAEQCRKRAEAFAALEAQPI